MTKAVGRRGGRAVRVVYTGRDPRPADAGDVGVRGAGERVERQEVPGDRAEFAPGAEREKFSSANAAALHRLQS